MNKELILKTFKKYGLCFKPPRFRPEDGEFWLKDRSSWLLIMENTIILHVPSNVIVESHQKLSDTESEIVEIVEFMVKRYNRWWDRGK